MDAGPQTTRRRLLAGLGTATAGSLAGCSERLWSRAARQPPEQVSLSVKTIPADGDQLAAKIASQFTRNLRQAGIDVVHEPTKESELYRDVLLRDDFGVFVARHPGFDDPDGLRSLLHSRYVTEQGWQNPFGFSDPTVDDYLETQVTERGYNRLATFTDLFEHLLSVAPYTAIAFPDHVCAATSDVGLGSPLRRPMDYVDFVFGSSTATGERTQLRTGVFDYTLTERLNPLTVDVGVENVALGLLYDPLVRVTDRGPVPWLADEVEWRNDNRGTAPLEATVTMRDRLTWHDGTRLDADDVAFTVRFLGDTSLGATESGVPAPRYRGRTALVDEVTVVDDRTVRLSFGEATREVAERVLTVPLFPEHVWSSKSDPIGDNQYLTEALVWDNPEPIGSGPFRFEGAVRNEYLRLSTFEAHTFRNRESPQATGLYDGPGRFDGVEFLVVPNAGTAIDALVEGELDLVGSPLAPSVAERASTETGIDVLQTPTRSFYVVGFNVRHPQLGNPRFRRIVSRLIDRRHVVDEFFGGHATPATTRSSLAGIEPAAWEFPRSAGVDPFPGSDGAIDSDEVRSLFESAGYRYDDGALLS